MVFARGLLNHLTTRLYFPDEPSNAADPVLQSVPPERRPPLIAARDPSGDLPTYRFDVVLQGAAEVETGFFNV
jgi:protocatechuate 3,4-dioxygenase alpha subunit